MFRCSRIEFIFQHSPTKFKNASFLTVSVISIQKANLQMCSQKINGHTGCLVILATATKTHLILIAESFLTKPLFSTDVVDKTGSTPQDTDRRLICMSLKPYDGRLSV